MSPRRTRRCCRRGGGEGGRQCGGCQARGVSKGQVSEGGGQVSEVLRPDSKCEAGRRVMEA
eukprot:1173985-Prorocentrum_minimum.AAC.1